MTQPEPQLAAKLLSAAEVTRLTTLSRTTIWRAIRAKSFPASVAISSSRVAWFADDIEAWLAARRGHTPLHAAA